MPAHGLARTRGVRYNEATQCFEMWCPDCDRAGGKGGTFWPLTLEFWRPHSLQRCLACTQEQARRHEEQRRRTLSPTSIQAKNAAYYAANKVVLNAKRAARRAAKRGTIPA